MQGCQLEIPWDSKACGSLWGKTWTNRCFPKDFQLQHITTIDYRFLLGVFSSEKERWPSKARDP